MKTKHLLLLLLLAVLVPWAVNAQTNSCVIESFPWTENFNSYGNGYFTPQNGPCWAYRDLNNHGHSFRIDENGRLYLPHGNPNGLMNGAYCRLTLPQLELPSDHYAFSLDVYREAETKGQVEVFVSTNGSEFTTPIGYISARYNYDCTGTGYAEYHHGTVPPENGAGCYTYSFNIPYSGSCYIVLRCTSDWAGQSYSPKNLYMDNFCIREVPYDLAVSNITTSTADISWTPATDETEWRVQYGTYNTFYNGTFQEVTVTGIPSVTLTNLDPVQRYHVRVKAVYGSEKSGWSLPLSFDMASKYTIGRLSGFFRDVPFNTYNKYSYTQQIYTHNELGDAGAIRSIEFFRGEESPCNRNVDVYMTYTDKESFESTGDWISINTNQRVFSGTLNFSGDDWTVVELNTPFNYDGQHNLAIIVDDNTGVIQSDTYFEAFESDANQTLVRRSSDNINPQSPGTGYFPNIYNTTKTGKNRIRILKDYPTPNNPHCTAVTTTTATVDWNDSGTTYIWQICLNDDESNLITVTSNQKPYTLTGLNPGTQYAFKVRGKHDNSELYSAWSNKAYFNTMQEPESLPYSTDFETEGGWLLVNGACTNQWCWGEAAHNGEGPHGLYISNDGGTTHAYTINSNTMVYAIKTFDFEAGVYSFSYDWFAKGEKNYDFLRVALVPDSLSLEAGIALPTGFTYNTLPEGWIALDGGSQLNQATGWQTASYEDVIVPTAGTYKMVFAWRNDGSDGTNPPAAIDNVSITAITCPKPSNFTASNVGATTALLSWTGGADVDSYTLKYRTAQFINSVFSEGFEDGAMPSGWTQFGPGTWNVTAGYGYEGIGVHSGTYNATITHTDREDETFLITPMLDLSGQNALVLNFWYINYNWGEYDIDQLYVYYRVNEGEWVELWNTTEDHQIWTESGAIALPNLSANYQIGFKMIDKYGHGVGIDDIIIGTEVPVGEWQTVTVAGNAFQVHATLTDLTPNTMYEAQVKCDCDEAEWSDTITFRTLPPFNYTADFETECDWTFVNGDCTNAWTWGTAAHNGSGTHGLYISNDGGTTNAYSINSPTMVYAYKNLDLEADFYSFSYDWLANGESYYDFLRVALVPDSVNLQAGTSLPSGFTYSALPNGWIALDGGSKLNRATEWQTASNEVMISTPGVYKMVFAWCNDNSTGTNPPAAIDNVSITFVTCPAPTGLHIVQGSLSGHEVTMVWDNEDDAQYQYAMIQNDFIPETITFNSPSLGNGQSHYNNLEPETSYTFFLRKYCSDEDQSDIVSLTFTTDEACPAPVGLAATEVYGYSAKLDWTASSDSYTVSYRTKACMTGIYEEFNTDAVPTGWTRYSGLVDEVLDGSATLTTTTSGWVSNSNAFGAYNMKVNIYGTSCMNWLVTPEVNVGSNNTLDFNLALTDYNNSDPIEDPTAQADDRFVVLVYADGAWSILREWNNTGSDDVFNTIATTGEHISINLSAYAGKTVKIAFYGESIVANNGDNDLHIDNVGIGLPVPVGEWQTVIVDEAPVWLTGLTPETLYEAKVQGDCGDDGLSEETAIIFTTIEACPVPTELTTEANLITSTTANLQWNGSIDVQSYTVRHRTAAAISQPVFSEGFENGLDGWTLRDCHASTGINASAAHSGQNSFRFYYSYTPPQYLISPELSGITEGMWLEFYYRNQSSDFPETFQMGFSSTNNATESFTFGDEITAFDTQWHLYSEPIPAGTKYICWKLNSYDKLYLFIDDIAVGTVVPAGEWQTANATTTNVTLTGLTPDGLYEAQVKSDCGEPRWSEMITFHTLPLSTTPTDLQCTAVAATSAELSWSCEAAMDSYTVRYRTAPVFSEGFENGLGDWTLRNCHANTGIIASAAHSSQYGFLFRYDTTPPQYLISPELSGVGEDMVLEFYYKNADTQWAETFQMGFSSTDNATESFIFGEEITASDTQWHLYSEPIPAGTKYICWKLTSNDQYYLYIDDIVVGQLFEWQTVTATTTHVTLTGLINGTTYQAQVKGDCEDCEWSETVSFTTTVTQTLNLASGVNWVSFYVETTLDDLKAALMSASNNASGIKITSQSNGFISWNGSSWRGSLNSIDVSQMYVIEVPAACEISLEAMPIDPAEHPITIVNGVNWIGFPFSASMTLTNAFDGFAVNGDKVSSLNGGSANYQGSWSGGLSSLQPGQGYKFESTTTAPRTFTFPTGAKKAKPFKPMGK